MPHPLAEQLVARLLATAKRITTVESCTGGLVAGAITSVAGSSQVFDYGFVTYSNAAKTAMVGVPQDLLAVYGAVSEPVARAMAEGGRIKAAADMALSITGIAGPSGGTAEKPVGMVCFGLSFSDHNRLVTETRVKQFGDIGRDEVRAAAMEFALGWALEALSRGDMASDA